MKSCTLLDSEPTTYIFVESKYLTNIKTVPTTLHLMTNGGLLSTNQQKHLNNYGNVWYQNCSSPRRPLFQNALSFECTTKLCINFINQFLVYFHI